MELKSKDVIVGLPVSWFMKQKWGYFFSTSILKVFKDLTKDLLSG